MKRLTPETAEEAEVASLRQTWKLSESLAQKMHALIQQEQKQAEALGQTYNLTTEIALRMIADLRSSRPPYVASNDEPSLRRASRPRSVRTTGAETHVPGE